MKLCYSGFFTAVGKTKLPKPLQHFILTVKQNLILPSSPFKWVSNSVNFGLKCWGFECFYWDGVGCRGFHYT